MLKLCNTMTRDLCSVFLELWMINKEYCLSVPETSQEIPGNRYASRKLGRFGGLCPRSAHTCGDVRTWFDFLDYAFYVVSGAWSVEKMLT